MKEIDKLKWINSVLIEKLKTKNEEISPNLNLSTPENKLYLELISSPYYNNIIKDI